MDIKNKRIPDDEFARLRQEVLAQVLGQEELEDVKPDCLILDLASKPGGVDLGAAGALGLTVVWALSLPGKVAPVTAGAAIRDTIYNMLREIGM